jgi:hypothetical protein
MKMGSSGHVARMVKMILKQFQSEESEGKRQLGRPRCRRGDNIRMDVREIGSEGVNWTHLDQERASEHSNEPSDSIKCGEFLTINFPRRILFHVISFRWASKLISHL